MNKPRSRLLSLPFISLYAAAAGAVFLEMTRERWGSAPWFPLAVGMVAALAIIPLRHLAKKRMLDTRAHPWPRIVMFFCLGTVPLAGLPFLHREDLLLGVGIALLCGVFLWAGFGTIFEWPGFKPKSPPLETEDD